MKYRILRPSEEVVYYHTNSNQRVRDNAAADEKRCICDMGVPEFETFWGKERNSFLLKKRRQETSLFVYILTIVLGR